MPAASTKLCRVMCAAAATYSIGVKTCALPPSDDRFYAGSGLTKTKAFCGGDDHTNACLVGTNADGVVVAFRGTLEFDINLWAGLVDWVKNDISGIPLVAAPNLGSGVKVHSGWWRDLHTIWQRASTYAKTLQDGNGSLIVTGHSKGGPLAAMAAACFQAENTTAELITFASPNPGNDAFAALFGSANQPTSTNYENYGDIIPLVPPSPDEAWDLAKAIEHTDWKHRWELAAAFILLGEEGYAPVNGKVLYVDQAGNPGTAPDISTRMANVIANYNAYGGPEAFGAAHCHACYCKNSKGVVTCAGGYMKAACPGQICQDVGTTCPD